MKLPTLLQKPFQIVALSAGALLGSGAGNEIQAQQFYPNPGNEIFGRGINYGPGPYGAAGSNLTFNYWAPEFNRQIQNPTRNNFNRSQGQAFSRPQASPNPGYSPNQVDPRSVEKQKKHEAILEQIKNAKTSPDGTFKYVLNINDSKFHLIIPISKDFQLPDMKEMYRVKFKDPFKAGTPYYYLVTNDSIEKSYQQQQTKAGSQTSTTEACRSTTSSLRKLCCPCE